MVMTGIIKAEVAKETLCMKSGPVEIHKFHNKRKLKFFNRETDLQIEL